MPALLGAAGRTRAAKARRTPYRMPRISPGAKARRLGSSFTGSPTRAGRSCCPSPGSRSIFAASPTICPSAATTGRICGTTGTKPWLTTCGPCSIIWVSAAVTSLARRSARRSPCAPCAQVRNVCRAPCCKGGLAYRPCAGRKCWLALVAGPVPPWPDGKDSQTGEDPRIDPPRFLRPPAAGSVARVRHLDGPIAPGRPWPSGALAESARPARRPAAHSPAGAAGLRRPRHRRASCSR